MTPGPSRRQRDRTRIGVRSLPDATPPRWITPAATRKMTFSHCDPMRDHSRIAEITPGPPAALGTRSRTLAWRVRVGSTECSTASALDGVVVSDFDAPNASLWTPAECPSVLFTGLDVTPAYGAITPASLPQAEVRSVSRLRSWDGEAWRRVAASRLVVGALGSAGARGLRRWSRVSW